MRHVIYGVMVVAVVSLCSAAGVQAQPHEGAPEKGSRHGGMMGEGMGGKGCPSCQEKMLEELGLTPDQQKKMEAHKERHMKAMKETRDMIRQKREEIRQALEQETVDLEAVRAVHQQIKDLLVKQEDARLEAILEVKKILTPEQFVKFHAQASKMRHHRMKGMAVPEGDDTPDQGPHED